MSSHGLRSSALRVLLFADLARGLLDVVIAALVIEVCDRVWGFSPQTATYTKWILASGLAACCTCFVRLISAGGFVQRGVHYSMGVLLSSVLETVFLLVVFVLLARPHPTNLATWVFTRSGQNLGSIIVSMAQGRRLA